MGRIFQDNLHAMLFWFLSPKSHDLDLNGPHTVKMLAKNIVLGYKHLNLDFSPKRTETIQTKELQDAEYIKYDQEYLAPVLELKKIFNRQMKDQLVDCFVHGSLATLDYAKGWSDFDTFLIIKKETIFDTDSLVDLRAKLLRAYPKLLQIDSLQHHGFLLCTEIDLSHYNQSYLPVEVLRIAKSYFRTQKITFNVIDTIGEERKRFFDLITLFKTTYETGILKHHAYKGVYLLSNYRNSENGMYQFKYLLNSAALIPSYYFGALGKPTCKRDAINKIKPLLSEKNQEFLEKVSFIRSEWPKNEEFPYKNNKVPQWIKKTIGKHYFKQMYDYVKEIGSILELEISEKRG